MFVALRIVERLHGLGITIDATDIFGRAGVLAGNQVGGNGIFLSVFFFAVGDVAQGDAMFPGVS